METLDFDVDVEEELQFTEENQQQDSDSKGKDCRYEEVFVKSFKGAVDTIEKDGIFNNEVFNICLLDIDGVIFEDNMVKLPVASHLANPKITESCKSAYNRILTITDGNMAISTNRSENEKYIFNSQNVLKQVKKLVNSNDVKVPIFTCLFKQKPGMTVENISAIHENDNPNSATLSLEKVIKPKIDALVHYIGKLASEKDYPKYNLTSIEDWSFVSLNRKDFLLYVSNQLKELYGIEIEEIRNYVVKR